MKNVENEYRKYIDNNVEVPNIKNNIKSRIEFKKKEGFSFMSKKWVVGLSSAACIALVAGVTLGVCFGVNGGNNKNREVKALVNVDVNPSVEFAIDKNNKVVSVTGLNDEGEMIIYGEALIGKDISKAIDTLIKVETETGYILASGRVEDNTISLSVTCESDALYTLKDKVETAVTDACAKYDIHSAIETSQKYTRDQLEAIALKCDPTLTEEKVKEMSIKELCKVISIYHIETSDIVSEKIEDLYVQVRDNEISFSESEYVQDAINNADGLVKTALSGFNTLYTNALDSLKQTYDALEETRYSIFVDENSDYQKALKSVNDAKDDVLKYRNEVASTDHNNEDIYNALVASLDAADTILDTANTALLSYEELGNQAIETAKAAVDLTMTTLTEVATQVETILAKFDKDYMQNKVVALEKAMNEAKNQAFTDFEAKYKDDINNAKHELKERKAKLIEQI